MVSPTAHVCIGIIILQSDQSILVPINGENIFFCFPFTQSIEKAMLYPSPVYPYLGTFIQAQ